MSQLVGASSIPFFFIESSFEVMARTTHNAKEERATKARAKEPQDFFGHYPRSL
jgi:hypothetical protein